VWWAAWPIDRPWWAHELRLTTTCDFARAMARARSTVFSVIGGTGSAELVVPSGSQVIALRMVGSRSTVIRKEHIANTA
jgi:hypothetical protein